ncbi:hypothetical protein PG999_012176 [Apiospora kogelbergensis]|uniref:Ubiquitin-like protease family profile domain-containing protein n=1 Tax=Apiospora kogelbergensis TaxID=1337665 RepID=A0AAW0QMB1_9PEZI
MVALKVVERHRVGVDRFYGLDFSLVYDPTTGCLSRRDGLPMLPGQPWASLSSNDELLSNVERDHKVSSLERLKSSMYIPSTPNSKAVTPLHAYDCIIATQHPDLHLTLTGNSVYLKPIPVYMLCVDFWHWLAVAPNDKNQATYKAAMGFMRTYCLLIRYASDFRKAALIHELIPRDLKVKITYESFVGFISQFANVPDSDVAPRYTHGELALRSFVSPHRLFLEAPEEDETEDGDNEKERTENQPASASSYKSWSVSSGPVTTAKADDPSTLAPSLFELSSMLFLLFFGGPC